MRAVEYPPISKQFDANTRALSFSYFCPKGRQQGLNVTPLDASRHWSREDQSQSSLVFAVHVK